MLLLKSETFPVLTTATTMFYICVEQIEVPLFDLKDFIKEAIFFAVCMCSEHSINVSFVVDVQRKEEV
jgi:hypothetical protein